MIPIFTAEEYAERLGCTRELVTIAAVERETINNADAIVVYFTTGDDQRFGVILDRIMAEDLTRELGPHPMIEEFFRLH